MNDDINARALLRELLGFAMNDDINARALLRELLGFAEYVSDILNNMDAVEEEDEKRENGVLKRVRDFLDKPARPPEESP